MAVRLPASQRRRQLLDVACAVFAARGFHATAMDDVAEAAGVTKPVLYQHFGSKRALYRELLEEVDRDLLDRLRDATGRAATPRGRVEAGFAAYFRFVTEHRDRFRLLFGASVRNDAEFAAIAEDTIAEIAALIAGLIELEVSPAHRLALAHAIVGMAEATSRRFGPNGEPVDGDGLDPDRLARWLAELTWFGLRGVRPEP